METFADNRIRVAALLTLLLVSAATAMSLDAHSLEQRLARLTAASPPEFWEEKLLLTYKPSPGRPVRYVGARFEHENWARLHVFNRKAHYEDVMRLDEETGVSSPARVRVPTKDVFYLVYDNVPAGTALRYRIVVDGLWMPDPSGPSLERDLRTGLTVSIVEAPKAAVRPLANPTVTPGGQLSLFHRGAAGRTVTVAGDFNNWDPFGHAMSEDPEAPGLYRIELPARTKLGRYVIYVNGLRVRDPLNSNWELDADGRRVYLFGQ
jgi:hypothetical protein